MKLYQIYRSTMEKLFHKMPERARGPLVNQMPFYNELLRLGGAAGLQAEAARAGIRGKWTRDCEDNGDSLELSRRLGIAYERMKLEQANVSEQFLPHPIWEHLLTRDWGEGREAVRNSDWKAFDDFVRNFFRNGGITGVWGSGDMVGEFSRLAGWDDWSRLSMFLRQFEAWKREMPGHSTDELDHPKIGNPWGYNINGSLVVEPEFEYHELANRFKELLSDVDDPVVMEIGGGFGGFATQLLKAMPRVRYVGFDLPENVVIQAYNLTRCFPQTSVAFDDLGALERGGAQVLLLPNFSLPKFFTNKIDLALNVRSFAEMRMETLVEYFKNIDRLNPVWIFHENVTGSRKDGEHGISASVYPELPRYRLVNSSESRWPRYNRESAYPCREYLFLRSKPR